MKTYYERHKEERLEYQKRYNEKNKYEIKERVKTWREENREKIREYNRAYYANNKEKYLNRLNRYGDKLARIEELEKENKKLKEKLQWWKDLVQKAKEFEYDEDGMDYIWQQTKI